MKNEVTKGRPPTVRQYGWIALIALAAGTAGALASPPVEPLPIPYFSLDANSPSVTTAGTTLRPDDVLMKSSAPEEPPQVLISGVNLGLGRPGDELDDISFSRSDMPVSQVFTLAFSVDRATTGNFPPNPQQVAAETPFTVADQSIRGQAAGDAFLSFNRFDRSGIHTPLRAFPAGSNTLAVNNYDEGGGDFSAQPPTSARDYTAAPQDNVDTLAAVPAVAFRQTPAPYFTVSSNSTSLRTGMLPGTSGGDVFVKPNPDQPQPPVQLFASAAQLGVPGSPTGDDDIAALVVFDENDNGFFDAGDTVLFSLKPGSPALSTLPGRSQNPAADIFAARAVAGGVTEVTVFAHAIDIGLASIHDHVDGLEIYACNAGDACALNAGIRLIKGDKDNDGDVDLADYPYFVYCLSGPKEGINFIFPSPECREVFDFNRDNDVDLHDFAGFQRAFGLTTP